MLGNVTFQKRRNQTKKNNLPFGTPDDLRRRPKRYPSCGLSHTKYFYLPRLIDLSQSRPIPAKIPFGSKRCGVLCMTQLSCGVNT